MTETTQSATENYDMACEHGEFHTDVSVIRLGGQPGQMPNRYLAEVRVRCAQCDKPFRFRGLPMGLGLDGAAVSGDGQEVRLAIAPVDEVIEPCDVRGFTVKGPDDEC